VTVAIVVYKGLKLVVYRMLTKHGEEKKQRELWQLEKKVADLVNEGFLTDYESLISYLRHQYQKRNYPKIFANAYVL
jgi:hypothetical protein